MKPTYLLLACLTFLAMSVLALALLGNLVDPLPAAAIETMLFAALMWASGRIESDL